VYRHRDVHAFLPVQLERGATIYVHTYICISLCSYIHTCEYTYMHMYMQIFIYVCIHKDVLYIFPALGARRSRRPYIYAYLYVYTYVYIYIHAYIFIYACVYAHVPICIFVNLCKDVFEHFFLRAWNVALWIDMIIRFCSLWPRTRSIVMRRRKMGREIKLKIACKPLSVEILHGRVYTWFILKIEGYTHVCIYIYICIFKYTHTYM